MTPNERSILLNCGLFQAIPEEQAEKLFRCLSIKEVHYKKNDVLWNIGDPVQACAVILTGALRAETITAGGERTLMAYHRAGSLVGDVLMATPDGRSPVSVTAAEDTTLVYIPFHKIMGGCRNSCTCHTLLRENLISEIAQKFWAQRRRANYLAVHSLRKRIAMRLWDEHLRTGSLTLTLDGTREDLADFLAVNRSALSRELSRMKEEGILDFYKDTFRILQPEQLSELAG